jgi:methylmalonyl-CoA mutase C-terminal domain/subunit
MPLVKRIMELLQENEMQDVPVFLGGIIPNEDIKTLTELGISGIFGPGASMDEIVAFIWKAVGSRPAEDLA